jgi:hypothetical protein
MITTLATEKKTSLQWCYMTTQLQHLHAPVFLSVGISKGTNKVHDLTHPTPGLEEKPEEFLPSQLECPVGV